MKACTFLKTTLAASFAMATLISASGCFDEHDDHHNNGWDHHDDGDHHDNADHHDNGGHPGDETDVHVDVHP